MHFFSAFPVLFVLMHFFFNICMFAALAQIWKVKAVKFLQWRFVPFQNTNPYPFRIKTRNVEKNLFTFQWGSCEVWMYVINSSAMEMKSMQYKLLRNNSCKENLDFSICYLSKVWNPWPRKCFIFYSKEPVEFSVCRFFYFFLFWFLSARVLLTLSVRGKLCCNWERERKWLKNRNRRVICIRQRNK